MFLSCSLEEHTLPLASTAVSLVSVTVCEWLAVLQSRNMGPLRAAFGHLFLHFVNSGHVPTPCLAPGYTQATNR